MEGQRLALRHSISWRALALLALAVTLVLLRELRVGTAQAQATAVKINFQPAGAPAYAGYLIDGGAVYGARGNGYTYGWNVDNATWARDRNAVNSADQRYDTLNHMQKGAGSVWEIALPNGSYNVRIVAGDALHFDSVYNITAEGLTVVGGTPSSTTRWFDGTRGVSVADGRLTIASGAGASNNKINFIEISSTAIPATSTNTATSTRLPCGAQVTATPSPTASSTATRTPTTTATRTNTSCGVIVVTNTSVPPTPTGPGGLPDLVISSMYLEMDGRTPGRCVNQYTPYGVRVHVANTGPAGTGSFVVSVGSSQQTVSSLGAGQTVVLTFSGVSGTAVADSTNVVAESNESNNSYTLVAITPSPPARCTATPVLSMTPTPTGRPTADFSGSPRQGPAPLTVVFGYTGTANITSCSWNFGDGTPVQGGCGQLSHTYAQPGSYTVSVTACKVSTLCDTETKADYIVVSSGPTWTRTPSPTITRTPTTTWGRIQGTVRKEQPTGPVVQGVTVLLSVNGGAATTRVTDANGFYWFDMPTKNTAPVPVRLWTSPSGEPTEYSWSFTWGVETRDFTVP